VEPFPPPLRVGIVVESLLAPAWVVRAVENVAASPHAVLSLVIRGAAAAASVRRGVLASAYARVDARRFRTKDDALDVRDLAPLVAHVPVVGHGDPSIVGSDLDVVLAFGAADDAKGRFGVWSIEMPDGLVEMAARRTHTVSTLKRLDDGAILGTARVATDMISLHRAMNRLRWKSAALPARALHALRMGGGLAHDSPENESTPRARSTAGLLLSVAGHYAAQKVRDVAMNEQWLVAFRFREPGEHPIAKLQAFHRIEPPKDRLWADPFVIQDGDRAWIFVEEMLFAEGRGVLAVIEARRDGTWSPPVRILERPYHLSYPCVFRWNGAFYMIPETGGSGTVQLFRATDFPYHWEQVSVLLRDLEAVDATPFEHDGRWWLYLTTASTPNVYDELSLYTADTPLGPWTPHRLNPLLSDLTGGRCAGRPFLHDGAHLRAAQNGIPRYGHAMQLRQLLTLDDTTWQEQTLTPIPPTWAPHLAGTHTLNVDGEVVVVDGMRDRWRRG
jgi:hypothetical protein